MNWFDNLSIRQKLMTSFVVSGGILIAAIVFAVFELHVVHGDVEAIADKDVPALKVPSEISELRLRYRVRSLEYMLPATPDAKAKLAKDMEKLDGMLRSTFADYEKMLHNDKEREVFRQAVAAADAYLASVEKAIALSAGGDEAGAQELRKTEWVNTATLLSDRVSELAELQREETKNTVEHALGELDAGRNGAIIGESGRGFAVVADEVRKLAERTSVSTGEISTMVNAIQQSTGQVVGGVNRGVQLAYGRVEVAQQAGASIAQLRDMAQQVADVIRDVDSGLREQSTASNDVAVRVEQIATQSEEASAIAHETSRAAETLDAAARQLQAAVSRFRV